MQGDCCPRMPAANRARVRWTHGHRREPCTIFCDLTLTANEGHVFHQGPRNCRGTHSETAWGLPGSWRKAEGHVTHPVCPPVPKLPPACLGSRRCSLVPVPSSSKILNGQVTDMGPWRGCGDPGTLTHHGWECVMVQLLRKTAWRVFKNAAENCHPAPRSHFPKDAEAAKAGTVACKPTFTAALVMTAKTWKQKRLPVSERRNEREIDITETHSALKRKGILGCPGGSVGYVSDS